MAQYKVIIGLDAPSKKGGEVRYEPGDVVSDADLPQGSLKWLMDDGVIELISAKKGAAEASKESD